MKLPYKLLCYDIETTPLLGWIWRPGEQYVGHNQLLKGYFNYTHIMCITYRWAHEKKTHILTWGTGLEDEKQMIIDFDAIVKQADVVIGKNNNRFDDKHINTIRMIHDLPCDTSWITKCDDLEKQMRKHFNVASYSLDYFSELLGLGGKIKMELSDWLWIAYRRMLQLTDIESSQLVELLTGYNRVQVIKEGNKRQKHMFTYGTKDSDDTLKLWFYLLKHFTPKFNAAKWLQNDLACIHCGSTRIVENGNRFLKTGWFKRYDCHNPDHGGYAGKRAISKKTGLPSGRML